MEKEEEEEEEKEVEEKVEEIMRRWSEKKASQWTATRWSHGCRGRCRLTL